MLSTGSMDRRIAIQRNDPAQELDGALTENWTQVGHVRWARRAPVGGTERFTAQQFIAREQVQWTLRWTADLADLSPADRVIYPTSADPADTGVYDIIAVHEMGWREGLVIVTARRTEPLIDSTIGVPSNALLAEDGTPILTEDGSYILTEEP